MYVNVYECMNVCVCDVSMDGRMDEWMDVRPYVRTYVWVDECMYTCRLTHYRRRCESCKSCKRTSRPSSHSLRDRSPGCVCVCVCVYVCVCVSISRNLAQGHICVQLAYTQEYGLVRAHIHMCCMHIMTGSIAFTHPGQVVIGYAATAARPSATAPAACAVSVAWRIAGLLLHAS